MKTVEILKGEEVIFSKEVEDTEAGGLLYRAKLRANLLNCGEEKNHIARIKPEVTDEEV